MRGSRKEVLAWSVAAIAFISLTVGSAAWLGLPHPPSVPELADSDARRELSIDRIRDDVRAFSSEPTRLSGSRGAEVASNRILQVLREMKVPEVQTQEFEVAVPITRSASLEFDTTSGKASIPLHPLWPNLARTSQTPPEGLSGPMVYAGRGSEAEMNGKSVNGSLVVLDWAGNQEWMNAPEFGGKAVIFRANDQATGNLARAKFLTVPADIPRFYVKAEDTPKLDAALASKTTSSATIKCDSEWQRTSARNILARITPVDSLATTATADTEPIIFHAYYDSMSVVPELSPGAEQACGAALLLELGRHLQGKTTRRPIYLLFTGGHGQSLAGMTHFVSTLRAGLESGWSGESGKSVMARMGRPGLFVGVDISSHSDQFGIFCMGRFRNQNPGMLRARYSVLGLQLKSYADSFVATEFKGKVADQVVDCINLTLGREWTTYFPYQAAFESELPTLAGIPAITLATVNDDRRYVDTPNDSVDRVRFDLLAQQIGVEKGKRVGMANVALALTGWKGSFVSAPLEDNWGRLTGRVLWLDQERNFMPSEPLKRATVFLKMLRSDKFVLGTRAMPTVMTDDEGNFVFDGLLQNTNWLEVFSYTLEAYGTAGREFLKANPRAVEEYGRALRAGGQQAGEIRPDGRIVFALDMARRDDYPWQTEILKHEQSLNLVSFPCRSFTLLGLTDPRGYISLQDLQILETASKSPPFSFGQSVADMLKNSESENVVTLWADPTLRIMVNLGLGLQDKRLILINGTSNNPTGSGFVLDQLGTLKSVVLQGAGDMWTLNESRINKLEANGVNNPRVRQMHAEARSYMTSATAALTNRDYLGYRYSSERLWAIEGKVYTEVLGTVNNMIRGVLFYLALLLPFSYCLERLIVGSKSIERRIIGIGSIFMVSFGILAAAHPAFRFTLTPFLVLLAFIILALLMTVSVILLAKVDGYFREQKQAGGGIHEEQGSAGNVAMRAVDLGIANIRKRPQRGFLTGLTVVLVTFTLLSFTSLVPVVSISKLHHPEGKAVYKGLLARDRQWNRLPDPLYFSMKRSYQHDKASSATTLAGRAWFYADLVGNQSQIDVVPVTDKLDMAVNRDKATSETRIANAVALLCLDANEPKITGVDKTLVSGRWFDSNTELAAIVPISMAEQLGLKPSDLGKKIRVYGRDLPIIGFVDGRKMDKMVDLDGEPLSPVNFVQQQFERAKSGTQPDTLEEYVHYSNDQVVILPFQIGHEMGATVRSIAVRTGNEIDPYKQAEGYARRSDMTILASDGQNVTLFAALDTSQLSAAGQVLIPLALGFLMVLGTMLGSVFERRREIFIYNSVGLSPTNVSSLFLAESSVYAIIGAGLGYLLGQVVSRVLFVSGTLSGLSLNYTAGTTIFVTVLTMAIVIASTLYPARQAFHAATPDSRHDDTLEEGVTDEIALYLPFVCTQANVLAMQTYVHEYLLSLQGVTIGELAIDDLMARLEVPVKQDDAGPLGAIPVLTFRAWLAPFDLGVSHDAALRIVYRPDRGIYQYHLTAKLFSGDQQSWRRLTPRFVQAIRKQLLMWRILPRRSIDAYRVQADELFNIPKEVEVR